MAGRLCSIPSLCTIILLEIAFMLAFWVGDYLPPIFGRTTKPCDVTNSSIVRKLVQKNWAPVLNRYGVSLPVECPLNLSRDLLGVRESVKSKRGSHYQCLKCGKKFYLERHLDLHMERRHAELINNAEDSICFGQYCDVMRCDVLNTNSFLDEDSKSTDISIWTPIPGSSSVSKQNPQISPVTRHIGHKKEQEESPGSGETKGGQERVQDSPSQSTEQCDEAYYSNLKRKCTDLVWECLQGLISILDAKDFKAIQNELESVSCSYLSCSRYGDKCCSSHSKVRGKLRPFFIVFGSLFISLCLALAYYFTWIYTQGVEDNLSYEEEEEKQYKNQEAAKIRQTISLVNRTTHL